MTQQAQFSETFSDERLFSRLATFFGLLAVLLVATGLYGTLAYRVSRRTSEIGVRMALGAERWQVLWMVLRESLITSVAGVAIGLPLAIAASRLLKTMLFGLSPGDPASFASALAAIALVALGASLVPAARGVRRSDDRAAIRVSGGGYALPNARRSRRNRLTSDSSGAERGGVDAAGSRRSMSTPDGGRSPLHVS